MTLQEQIDTIQAVKDGRVVTRTVTKSGNTYRVPTGHFFDFIHNTYTIEPLYQEGEVIMVGPTVVNDGEDHTARMVRNGTTVKLYVDGNLEATATEEALDGWMPAFFHEMSGDNVMVSFIDIEPSAVPRSYPYHRKLNATDKGEA
ncbi:MAG: hypothetical protein GY941_05020 [Planctomycetes bacterium]|nr:hypothetical protein [Planctomycetota bacterium]